MPYRSSEHVAARGTNVLLVRILEKAKQTTDMQRKGGTFLDCHEHSKKWADTVGNLETLLKSQGYRIGPALQKYLVQVVIHRTDATERDEQKAWGEHVAAVVGRDTWWLLIDQTHNQFDLPIDMVRDPAKVGSSFRHVWDSLETYFAHGVRQQEVIAEWMTFLQTKHFLAYVQPSGIRLLRPTHDFDKD